MYVMLKTRRFLIPVWRKFRYTIFKESMKIFKKAELPIVALICVCCALFSAVTLDRVYRGQTESIVNGCTTFDKRLTNIGPCQRTALTDDYGWPLVSRRVDTNPNTKKTRTFHQNSIELARNSSVYLTYNAAILSVLVIVIYAVYLRFVKHHLRDGQDAGSESPIISSYYLLGNGGLVSLGQGEQDGHKYNLLSNSSGRVMMHVTLNANSKIHLVAVGHLSKSELPFTESLEHSLRKIVLEGDFPSYFKVYCTPGKENEVLQILEPVTMQYLADFCKSYQFEIFHDTLYVAKAEGALDKSDSTTLVADVFKLLKYHGDRFGRL